jgi:hypothetical protein
MSSNCTLAEIGARINHDMKKQLFHQTDTNMYSAKLKMSEDPNNLYMILFNRYIPPPPSDGVIDDTSNRSGNDLSEFYMVETNLEFSEILALKLGFTTRRKFTMPIVTSPTHIESYEAEITPNICTGNEYLFIHIPNLTGDTGELNNGLSKTMASICLRNAFAYKLTAPPDEFLLASLCKYRHVIEQPVYYTCAGDERLDQWTVTFQNANNRLINWLYRNLGDIHIKLHFRQRNLYY